MTYYRQILDNASESVIIPAEFRHRRIELILLPLDEVATNGASEQTLPVERDSNGWPLGFFDQTFGSIPDFPERDPQGEYEVRDEML